jgi:hypothetical protein
VREIGVDRRVHDATRARIAEAEFPARLQVRVIEADAVWGVEMGSFEAQQQVADALERGTADQRRATKGTGDGGS